MDVFVTGATGYIGEAVADELVQRGHRVTGLTRDVASAVARTSSRAGVRMVAGDVGDPSSYRAHLGTADVVIHTVADAKRPVEADRDLFRELMATRPGRPAPHVIYTTGCSVYGAHSYDVLTERTPTDPLHPRAVLENELRAAGPAHTIIRPAFVFGRDGRSSLLGRWLDPTRPARGEFYGDPAKRWSWIHVDDLARAYAAVVDDLPRFDGETFLLADDDARPALETFRACQSIDGPEHPVTFAPIEEEDELYRVFDRDEIVDARKARDELGWRPRAGGVRDFIAARRLSGGA